MTVCYFTHHCHCTECLIINVKLRGMCIALQDIVESYCKSGFELLIKLNVSKSVPINDFVELEIVERRHRFVETLCFYSKMKFRECLKTEKWKILPAVDNKEQFPHPMDQKIETEDNVAFIAEMG